jgi:glycopeptide antibiotics resistance protein
VIFVATLTPTGGENELHLIPFQEIAVTIRHPFDLQQSPDTVANILLFFPIGALMSWRPHARLRSAVLAGVGLSMTVEVAQLFIPGRWTSTDDVLLNGLGAFLGYRAGNYLYRRLRGVRVSD